MKSSLQFKLALSILESIKVLIEMRIVAKSICQVLCGNLLSEIKVPL